MEELRALIAGVTHRLQICGPWDEDDAGQVAVANGDLTAAALAAALPEQRKQLPDFLAGKITGMLLEMDNMDILDLVHDPALLLAQEALEVLLLNNHRDPAAPLIRTANEVQEQQELDASLPPASRPLLTVLQWAALPAEKRRPLMKQLLFYCVHQMQPLMSCHITKTVANLAQSSSTAVGWYQQGSS
ncbi:hypothetical protein ABPG75_007190 [Micractinium tetrahymenae]